MINEWATPIEKYGLTQRKMHPSSYCGIPRTSSVSLHPVAEQYFVFKSLIRESYVVIAIMSQRSSRSREVRLAEPNK